MYRRLIELISFVPMGVANRLSFQEWIGSGYKGRMDGMKGNQELSV